MSNKAKVRWGRRLLILTVLLVGAGSAIWYFKGREVKEPKYTTEKIERGDLTQLVTATGTLNPVVNVTIGSQVSGRICKLNVDYNSIVKSNQVIAEIDPSTYQAAYEQAKADLANAKANEELQGVEAERSSELYTNKLISRSDYDTAIATLHEAQATVQMKQASLHNAEANLGYCKIVSPVDGEVISRSVELGQTVASSFNTPTLFQIANDLTRMQIDTSVDESDIGGIKEGESVDFTVGAYPNRTFHGAITQVRNAPTTVNNVVTYDVVIGVTNSDYSLKPGMTASVSIEVARHSQVLQIANAALRFQPPDADMVQTNTAAAVTAASASAQIARDNRRENRETAKGWRGVGGSHAPVQPCTVQTVYVLRGEPRAKEPKLEPMAVTLGITDNIHTEVVSGLKEGDEIVTGLAIPGLKTGQEMKNPFTVSHRF